MKAEKADLMFRSDSIMCFVYSAMQTNSIINLGYSVNSVYRWRITCVRRNFPEFTEQNTLVHFIISAILCQGTWKYHSRQPAKLVLC